MTTARFRVRIALAAAMLATMTLAWGCGARRSAPDAVAPQAGPLPAAPLGQDVVENATVQQVLDEPERFAGRRLRVVGRCLGWHGPAAGAAPYTRSDWQLGHEGRAIWVSSPLPPGCSPTGGGAGAVAIVALVDTDRVADPEPPGASRLRAFLVDARVEARPPLPTRPPVRPPSP